MDPADIAFLFLPTGPMQEVSLSSGWSSRFLDLASRCDEALAARRKAPQPVLLPPAHA